MALRNGQGQRKKYLTPELSSASNLVEDMCAIVSEFQSAKIGDNICWLVLRTVLSRQTPCHREVHGEKGSSNWSPPYHWLHCGGAKWWLSSDRGQSHRERYRSEHRH